MWKSAPWEKIRVKITEEISKGKISAPPSDLDLFLGQIQQVVLEVVNKLVLVTKPYPGTKRWWIEDLTELRKNFTNAGNIARGYRRQGRSHQVLEIIALNVKQKFFKIMKRQKKRHWDDFLDDLNNI